MGIVLIDTTGTTGGLTCLTMVINSFTSITSPIGTMGSVLGINPRLTGTTSIEFSGRVIGAKARSTVTHDRDCLVVGFPRTAPRSGGSCRVLEAISFITSFAGSTLSGIRDVLTRGSGTNEGRGARLEDRSDGARGGNLLGDTLVG